MKFSKPINFKLPSPPTISHEKKLINSENNTGNKVNNKNPAKLGAKKAYAVILSFNLAVLLMLHLL
jgi:hypothetical protein